MSNSGRLDSARRGRWSHFEAAPRNEMLTDSEVGPPNGLAFSCERQARGHRMLPGNQARGPHRDAV